MAGPARTRPLRRPRKRIAATALLLLAFCLVGVWPLIRPALLMTGADVYRLIPDRAVVVLAAGGNERALEESADRVVAASLSPKAESRLIDALLDFQADPTRPLHGATADALLVAFDAGRMTPAQAVRYVRDAQRAEFETRSVVRPGDPWQSYGFHVKGRPPETAGPARLRRQNRSQTVEAALTGRRYGHTPGAADRDDHRRPAGGYAPVRLDRVMGPVGPRAHDGRTSAAPTA